jgi:hypothetical protein
VIYSTGGGGSSRTYNPNQLGNRFCALWPRRDGNPFRQVVLPARRDARAAVSASVLAGGLMARRQDRQPRSWINRVDEAAAETKGVGIACRGAASGGGSGWCGAGPAVVRGQSVENALGKRAQLPGLRPRQAVENELSHCSYMRRRDFLQSSKSRTGQNCKGVATVLCVRLS